MTGKFSLSKFTGSRYSIRIPYSWSGSNEQLKTHNFDLSMSLHWKNPITMICFDIIIILSIHHRASLIVKLNQCRQNIDLINLNCKN